MKALKGKTPRRVMRWFQPEKLEPVADSHEEQSPAGAKTPRGKRHWKQCTAAWEGKTLKGKPHERIWHGIRPSRFGAD
jgi:hypothetical protein